MAVESREDTKEFWRQEFSRNVRRLLGMHLVQQDEFAAQVNLSRQAIHNIVNGLSMPSVFNGMKIARAFGISADALYSDAGTCLREAAANFEDAPIQKEMPKIIAARERAKRERGKGKTSSTKRASARSRSRAKTAK
jgi:DNA-binding XRE family transcriptional regulator